MKKVWFGIAATFAVMGIVFTGCKDSLVETSSSKTSAIELGAIGTQHNAILSEFYQLNNASRSASTGLTDEDVEEYFGDCQTLLSTSYEDANTIVSSLVSEANISEEVVPFIQQIEDLLENPTDSLDTMISAIVSIEEDAYKTLSEELYAEFESYADTAKASLMFWTENYELLSSESSARSTSSSSTVSVWQRIAMSVASDAAGAIAGYQEGKSRGYTGSTLVAYVAGCAAASSASGFANAELKVITL